MVLKNAFEDLALEATLAEVRDLLEGTLSTTDTLTLAKLEAVRALLDGTLDVNVTNMIAAVETGLSKEVTQALVYARLADIKNAVEAIAIDADTIAIDADTINLSTDQLEAILQQIRDNAIASDALQATAAKQDAALAKLELIRLLLANDLDIRNLTFSTDKVDVTGSTVTLDATTLAALETIGLDAATLAALETISVNNFPADYPSAAVLAKVEAVRVLLAGTLAVSVSNFPASVEVSNDLGNPLPALASQGAAGVDSWPMQDAAEDPLTTYAVINFNGVGAHNIVIVASGFKMRLRRFLLTGGDPDAEPPANPVLSFTFGGQSIRTTALVGRFDILGADGEDFVLTASKAGQVDGTIAYTLETA